MNWNLTIRTFLVAFIAMSFSKNYAQTARVQVIHNSPTPTVDIYANGAKLLDDFAYRTATPYIDVPAGVTINLGVGLASSASVRDTLVNFPVVLTAGRRYVVIANGIVGNAQTPFRLAISDMGAEAADAAANVGIAFFHGSPGAPNVDILTGGNVLFGNVAYGTFARGTMPYANVPANATYQLTVTPAGLNSTVVGRYDANLSFWAGKTAVVFASGFLSGGSVPFEPWVALSNGGTFALKATPTPPPPPPAAPKVARVQVIHNSPTPTVDIYANGNLLLDNFAFRTATPYVDLPAGVDINLGVGLATSRTVRDTLVNFRVKLDSGKTYIVVANGIVGSATRPFNLAISDKGQETTTANNVAIQFFHGSPDAPEVDILAGTSVLFDNISYGRFAPAYVSVPAASYNLAVTPGNSNTTIVARYTTGDLGFWKGKSLVVFASGFLTGGSPAFEPWVALSGGGTFPLRAIQGLVNESDLEKFALKSSNTGADLTSMLVYPNPAREQAAVRFTSETDTKTQIEVYNLVGQAVFNQLVGTTKGVNEALIPTANMNSGSYIVKIKTAEGKVLTQKLFVEK